MKNITYFRTLNEAISNRFVLISLLKRVVNFYYNMYFYDPNIFKNFSNMSINNTEHKKSLAFLKAAGSSNINLIY